MNEQIFVKRSHKDIKTALIVWYLCLLVICVIGVVLNAKLAFGIFTFLIGIFILFIYLIKLFDSFGIYVNGEKVIYKTFKRKEIDIQKIVGVKIIKAEGQVNIAWSSFDIKDKQKNVLYSMVFLSNIESKMEKYPYGNLEFLRTYRKSVVMYSVYDERLIDYLKEYIPALKIIN